jgi:hypothetical protein
MVTGLSKPLDHKEPFEFESDNETTEVEIDLQLYMQEKLARARATKDVTSIVKKESTIFEVEGKCRPNLESCLNLKFEFNNTYFFCLFVCLLVI